MADDLEAYPDWVTGEDGPSEDEDEETFRRETLPRLLQGLRRHFAAIQARHAETRGLLTPELILAYLQACRAHQEDDPAR